ncbi:AAA family ATPase [Fictibacillus sp. BK138]|uniref:AAA family ATPase n=1 Tax=Fictibacillus sp. BK138 TaxID=2512121 RepID=UPI001029C1A8|nr:AAA family ATPase [Fictibacillus sp. BK138]RZT23261.1 exonuclease SbcC [Fictibacillus sp. BK138]
MRPLHLNVSGLQSFREPQTIPFSELCSGGVFGIFGPTGSGKSTILDAVTLALYGKVERAAGGTHGIMNQAEDKLSVSFSFQLGQGDAEKNYTVERSYKRTGEHTIRTSTSRLIESVNGESVVHADKERDVTKLVQELLGLTIEDFTRAVVLPQGKFAEFLSLKGADRRQMLQRLFQLEKYGDVLNQKLKKRADEQKNRLNEITAEQSGLGDASHEALQEAESQLKEKERALVNISELLKAEEETYKLKKTFWETQSENEKLLLRQKELDLQLPEMEQLKQFHKKAVMADRLTPYAEEWLESNRVKKELGTEKEQLEQNAEKLKKLFVEHEKQYEQTKETKEKEEPELIRRLSVLEEAFQWEKDLNEKEAELQKETIKLSEMESSYSIGKKSEEDAIGLLEKGKNKQSSLKEELTAIEINHKERSVLQSALLLSQRFQSLQNEEQSIQNELKQAVENLEKMNQNIKHVKGTISTSIENWKALSSDVLSLYNEAQNAMRENESLSLSLHETLKREKEHQEKCKIKHLAAQLSSQLEENEPCSVCGSTVHPYPFNESKDDFESNDDKIEFLEAAKVTLQNKHRDLLHLSETLEKLSDKIWSKMNIPSEETAAASDAAVTESIKFAKTFDDEKLKEHSTKVKGTVQDQLSLENRFDALSTRFDEQQKQFEHLMFNYEYADKQVNELQQKLTANKKSKEEISTEWKEAEISFELDNLNEVKEEFEQRETRQSEIQESLKVAMDFLEKQISKIEKRKEENRKLEFSINTSKNQIKMLNKDIQHLKEKLLDRLGDNKASEQYEAVDKQLKTVATAYKDTVEQYERSRKLFLEADKAFHSILQRFEDALKRSEKAHAQWNEKLQNSIFNSFEEYSESVRDEASQQKWEDQLTIYSDQCKEVKAAIEALKAKLPDSPITEEEMLQQQTALNERKLEADATREAVGQAKQNWITIEKNHARFKELEEEKQKVSALLERLGKLQSVFRGNAFVEFMAEEQLIHVTRDASSRLSKLTRGRYAIEVDSNSGFVIRDDANGGIKRPVTSLSGGETFLTSLALALSLSAQIQLRGKFPLQFFFLDEGFGTLDQDLLDTVVTALEKVQMENFAIGVISHVPELKARLTKRLIVEPAEHSGNGTKVRLDQL